MDKCTLYCNTTSPVESHNKETKSKESGVKPNYSTTVATKVIMEKSNYKSSLKNQRSVTALTQRPSWSSTATSKHVTSFAEGLLKEQWSLKDNYSIIQVSKDMFWLCDDKVKKSISYVPRFRRVRTVSIENDRIRCSCKMFEQIRIACRHVMAITKDITIDFVGARYIKLFQYVTLKNDGTNTLFTDVMNRYGTLCDDNRLGIRICPNNVLYNHESHRYPRQLKGSYDYENMCLLRNWTHREVMINLCNHVLPSNITGIRHFLTEEYDVPNGLSQTVQMSSQCMMLTGNDTSDKNFEKDFTKEPFYARAKPIFDEIVKQVEANSSLADNTIDNFLKILNETKSSNNSLNIPTSNEKRKSTSGYETTLVSYSAKTDKRHVAKRHKYSWEKK